MCLQFINTLLKIIGHLNYKIDAEFQYIKINYNIKKLLIILIK